MPAYADDLGGHSQKTPTCLIESSAPMTGMEIVAPTSKACRTTSWSHQRPRLFSKSNIVQRIDLVNSPQYNTLPPKKSKRRSNLPLRNVPPRTEEDPQNPPNITDFTDVSRSRSASGPLRHRRSRRLRSGRIDTRPPITSMPAPNHT